MFVGVAGAKVEVPVGTAAVLDVVPKLELRLATEPDEELGDVVVLKVAVELFDMDVITVMVE